MKFYFTIFAIVISIFTPQTNSNYKRINTVVVIFGDKKPIKLNKLDDSLTVFYTPKLKVFYDSIHNMYKVKGKPKLLEEWSQKQNLQFHAIIFDKNGLAAWEGNLDNNNISSSKGFENMTFISAIEKYCVQKQTVVKRHEEIKFYSNQSIYRGKYFHCPLIGHKMLSFYVYDKNYNTSLIDQALIKKTPVLLVFLYIQDFKKDRQPLPVYYNSQKANNINTNLFLQQLIKITNQ